MCEIDKILNLVLSDLSIHIFLSIDLIQHLSDLILIKPLVVVGIILVKHLIKLFMQSLLC